MTAEQHFSGPLPPPDILKRYDEIVPGAAKNIIDSFVTEGTHRRSMETQQLEMCDRWAIADQKLQGRGQILGFFLGLTGIGGGLIVAAVGHGAAGTVVSSVALAAMVAAFLRQRISPQPMQQKENETESSDE